MTVAYIGDKELLDKKSGSTHTLYVGDKTVYRVYAGDKAVYNRGWSGVATILGKKYHTCIIAGYEFMSEDLKETGTLVDGINYYTRAEANELESQARTEGNWRMFNTSVANLFNSFTPSIAGKPSFDFMFKAINKDATDLYGFSGSASSFLIADDEKYPANFPYYWASGSGKDIMMFNASGSIAVTTAITAAVKSAIRFYRPLPSTLSLDDE